MRRLLWACFTFSNLSESPLCIGALVLIGVVFYGQFAESLLYLAVRCCRLNIEGIIVISPSLRGGRQGFRQAELQDHAGLHPVGNTLHGHAGPGAQDSRHNCQTKKLSAGAATVQSDSSSSHAACKKKSYLLESTRQHSAGPTTRLLPDTLNRLLTQGDSSEARDATPAFNAPSPRAKRGGESAPC